MYLTEKRRLYNDVPDCQGKNLDSEVELAKIIDCLVQSTVPRHAHGGREDLREDGQGVITRDDTHRNGCTPW